MTLDDETIELLGLGPGAWERMLTAPFVAHELRRKTTQEPTAALDSLGRFKAILPAEESIARAEARTKKHNRRKRKRSAAYMKRKRVRDAKRRAERKGLT